MSRSQGRAGRQAYKHTGDDRHTQTQTAVRLKKKCCVSTETMLFMLLNTFFFFFFFFLTSFPGFLFFLLQFSYCVRLHSHKMPHFFQSRRLLLLSGRMRRECCVSFENRVSKCSRGSILQTTLQFSTWAHSLLLLIHEGHFTAVNCSTNDTPLL